MPFDELIEALKREIEHKARWSGVPFDLEDIECHELYDGHHVVALMKIETPLMELEDGVLIRRADKSPNLWLEYRLPRWVMTDTRKCQIRMPMPQIRVRIPSLVCLVYPDGTYKMGGSPYPGI